MPTSDLATSDSNDLSSQSDGGASTPLIAFASARSGAFSLYVAYEDGTQVRAVVEGSTNVAPAWSPDGKHLAFSSNRGGDHFTLFALDIDTLDIRPIDTGTAVATLPAWSPDGQRIAFGTVDGIFVVDAAGGAATRLTTGSRDSGPTWAKDASAIYFSSDASSAFEIWAVAPDGTNLRQITTGAKIVGAPVVTPDGAGIAFAQAISTSGLGPTSGIAVYSLTTMQTTLVTSMGDSEPAFSPDGTRLAVSSTRYATDNVELVLMDWPSGANPFRLTDSPGTDSHSTFQPRR